MIDDTRRLRLSIAQVELPDGVQFEQYVLRMPKAAMTVLLDDARERVLMIWRHRFVPDCWTWELPGGYVDPGEDPAGHGGARGRGRDRLASPMAHRNALCHILMDTHQQVTDAAGLSGTALGARGRGFDSFPSQLVARLV